MQFETRSNFGQVASVIRKISCPRNWYEDHFSCKVCSRQTPFQQKREHCRLPPIPSGANMRRQMVSEPRCDDFGHLGYYGKGRGWGLPGGWLEERQSDDNCE